MDISEFFNQIITMAQSGNWNGIWTLVLGLFATILASVGGITGVIALINGIVKLFSSKKLLTKIGDTFNDTKTFFQSLFEQNKNAISDFTQSEITGLKSEITALQNNLNASRQQTIDLQNMLKSFIDTVLNSDELQLTYSNALKNLQLTQTDIKDTAKTVIADTVTEVKTTPIIEQATEVVDTKKKKIKLKGTENE